MSNCLYYGLFLNANELAQKSQNCGIETYLFDKVEQPHVTFAFHPKHAPYSLFGTKVEMNVVGYGHDDENEGFLVELCNPTEKIKALLPKGIPLHITLSVAPNGKARNTANLEFQPLETPFKIKGTLGGMIALKGEKSQELLNTPIDYQACESKFIIPFFKKTERNTDIGIFELDEPDWSVVDYKIKYLASYIQRIFEHENQIMTHYVLNEDALQRKFSLIYGDELILCNTPYGKKEQRWRLNLWKVEVVSFVTGVNFLVISVGYPREMSEHEMVQVAQLFGAKMSKQLNGNYTRIENENNPGKELFSKENAQQLLDCDDMEFFFSGMDYKCNTFHRVYRKEVSEAINADEIRLMKGWRETAEVSEDIDRYYGKHILQQVHNRIWAIDSYNVVAVSMDHPDHTNYFQSNVLQKNFDDNYFPLYLLALHEREIYLKFNNEAVEAWKNIERLAALKAEILELNTWAAYNVVSTESLYQGFYDKLYENLNLEALERDVEEVVNKADDYENAKREQEQNDQENRQNKLLFVIGFLAVFSALTDGTSFVSDIYGGLGWNAHMLDIGHIFVYAVIAIAFMIGIFVYRKKK